MTAVLFSLASVAAVSVVSLAGLLAMSIDQARLRRVATWLVSLAVGALLGDAFLHLLPEVLVGGTVPARTGSLLALTGMLLFFVVEKLLRHHHRSAPPEMAFRSLPVRRPELAAINLIGDAIHNFIDGALIAASYLVSPTLGITTTIAVLFHEIPQELGDFAVLIHSGVGVRKAVILNLASTGAAILGAVAALAAGAKAGAMVSAVLVPIAAGGFIYIAAADLIPELQRERGLGPLFGQAALIALGIALMGWI